MQLLLIEDDVAVAKSIALILCVKGFAVTHTTFGGEGFELAQQNDYDIVLLDLGLPDMHGHDVLGKLRDAGVSTPLLVLSGDCDLGSKVAALRKGADEFVTKPFHAEELLARIHAVIRRSHRQSPSVICVGRLAVNTDDKTASVDGDRFEVTPKEFAILELLSERKGTAVTKEIFLSHLYCGMDEPEFKIIDVFICKLRRKLREASGENYIHTVWGSGYMLCEPETLDLAA